MQNAILTEANGGIGREVLEKFAKKNINTWACVRKMTDEFIDFCEELKKIFCLD